MGKPRYNQYWYGNVVRMIRQYPTFTGSLSDMERLHKQAIDEAMQETEQLPDGAERVRAVRMLYFDKQFTFTGVADRLYISTRTMQRWISEFVYLVGYKAGY